jgi:hypothetical protein
MKQRLAGKKIEGRSLLLNSLARELKSDQRTEVRNKLKNISRISSSGFSRKRKNGLNH